MYEEGAGVAASDTEAVRWLEKAAAQGYAPAAAALGRLYEVGRGGLARSDTEAVSGYRKAAAQGDAAAEYRLGPMYESGRGDLRRATPMP